MDWSTKVNCLKTNLVIVARQMGMYSSNYQVKVILSGMHPIGQTLNFDDQREFQNRGTEYMQVSIHLVDAPKLIKMRAVEFIDNYVTYALLMRQSTLK